MRKNFKVMGASLGLLAIFAIMTAHAVTTVVNEDFENGAPGEVPSGWTSLGGTANFAPGIDDYRSVFIGNYDGGQTMALTNPFLEAASMVGAIVYNTPVDILNNKLTVQFDLLMSFGVSTTPADGCCLMILPRMPEAPGAAGGGMGWSGLGGFAVEFDIYDNGDADPDDGAAQTAYQAWLGDDIAGNTLGNPAARQVGVDVAGYNLFNDSVYSVLTRDADGNTAVYPNVPDFLAPEDLPSVILVRVWVEYDNGYIKVDMEASDPSGVYSAEYDFARDTVVEGAIGPWWFHGGTEQAFIGFAGAIGGSNALQEIDNLVVELDPNVGEEQFNPDMTVVELDPAEKVAEAGSATSTGWNVSTVKLNEESGQVFASYNAEQRQYKTHWVLDNTPPTATDIPLVVNYASGVNAANANGLFEDETGYPGIEFMPLDPPAEEQIDNFAVRATGFIEFPEAGLYFLGVSHDDSCTVFLNGQRVWEQLNTGPRVEGFKVSIPEAGIFPIQIDLTEQGYYSYFSVYEIELETGLPMGLINDGSRVKVYSEVADAVVPPTNWDAMSIATADPAEKVGEVGEGSNPGFHYLYRVMPDLPFDINNWVDGSMILTDGSPSEFFAISEEGVVQVVNWNGTATDAGNQPGDVALTGGDADDSAIRVSGFAEFPEAGMYALFVNSDDGFEAGIGSQVLFTMANKGASDSPAFVNIEEPGLYPLQVTWFERAGGNSFEFVQWTENGAALVNSEAATVKVYQDAPGADQAVFLENAYHVPVKTTSSATCLESGFNVRFVKAAEGVTVGNLTECEELLAGVRGSAYEDNSVQPFLDFWSTGGQGNFESGVPYPTLTADVDDNYFAIEATGFVELDAGWHLLGFNSDDGFELTIGGTVVRQYTTGKGVSNVNGLVYIPEAGYYPLRLAHWEGTGGGAAELYYIKEDGTIVLVNDTANGGPRVCAAIDGGISTAPVITSITGQGDNVVVTWEGGTAPYQVQIADVPGGTWTNFGAVTTGTEATIPVDAASGFIRVVPAN